MEQGDSRQNATPQARQEDRPRLALSATQLAASVLAAVTAAVGASYLGVNGTVIGAATVSLFSAVATAVYSHSITRTGARVRAVVPATTRWLTPREIAATPEPAPTPAPVAPRLSQSRLGQIALTAAAVFAAALALLTTVELFAGRPISDLVRGQSASGTTVFGSQPKAHVSTPTPTVTVTVVPKIVVTTPTVTQTAPPVTVTPTPTVTVTSTPTATPTPSNTTSSP